MQRYPKLALGLLIIIAFAAFLTISLIFKKSASLSSFTLESKQNKLHLQFNLNKRDKENFAQFLEKLSLQANLEEGITFQMDATSSAMLAFSTPVTGPLNLQENKVTASGKLAHPISSDNQEGESFRFPKSLNFAIAGPNLISNAATYLDLPPQIKNTIEDNSANSLQILALFDKDAHGIFIFKTGNFDVESFKDLPPSTLTYKEETSDSTKFSLVNNFVLFEIGEWTVISTSRDAAKAILAQQKNPEDSIYFPPQNNAVTPTASLLFLNPRSNPAPENLLIKIFGTKEKIPTFLTNVARIDFSARGKDFSAAIYLP